MSALKGTPGSIPWLLQHELRLYWRRGKMRPKSGIILLGILLGAWTLLSYFLFSKLGPLIPPPPFTHGFGDGLALAVIDVLIAFVGSVMTSAAILAAVEAIYTRNDLDLLLSSPVSPWRVLAVRSSAIALGALPLYAGMLAPPLLWLSIYSSPLWLSAIVFLVTLAFAGTGLALLIVTGLFRLIGPRNTRVLAQILSALAAASVYLAFQWFNVGSRRSGAMSQEEVATAIASFHLDPQTWWLFPARAMTGDLGATFAWIALCAILFPVGVFVFSRSFVSDAAAAAGMGRKRRVTDARIAAVRGGVMPSLIRKELRLLVRDPVLLSQIGLQVIYLIPVAFILLRPGGGVPLTAAAFAPALTLLSSTLSGSLIWITVSAEDAPDLISSAPVPTSIVDRAKLFAAIAPILTIMLIPLIGMFTRDISAGLWATGGVVFASVSSAFIGLWRRNPGSRRDFVRRRQGGSVVTQFGQTFVALGTAATVGLAAYNYPWLALIPAIIALAAFGALYKPAPKFAASISA